MGGDEFAGETVRKESRRTEKWTGLVRLTRALAVLLLPLGGACEPPSGELSQRAPFLMPAAADTGLSVRVYVPRDTIPHPDSFVVGVVLRNNGDRRNVRYGDLLFEYSVTDADGNFVPALRSHLVASGISNLHLGEDEFHGFVRRMVCPPDRACLWSFRLPGEGTYRVTTTYTGGAAPVHSDTATVVVAPRRS